MCAYPATGQLEFGNIALQMSCIVDGWDFVRRWVMGDT